MGYSRKQLVTCVSIVYLIFVTALSGYASSRANRLSVPISDVLTGFTTALPIVAGLLLEGGYDFNRVQERRKGISKGQTPRPPLVVIANTLIFIYSTVVITLLGTHASPPSGLDCGLKSRWTAMFHIKDAESIRAIQESLKCCGLVNSRDMAWPFPDKTHDQHACEKTYGHTTGCLGPWRQEEQQVAGILMAVVGLVFLWQFAIIATPTKRDTWLHSVVPDQISRIIADDEQNGSNQPRRAIDYLPRYRDNAPEEVSDDDTDSIPRRTIQGETQRARNSLPGGDEGQEQGNPALDNAWARN